MINDNFNLSVCSVQNWLNGLGTPEWSPEELSIECSKFRQCCKLLCKLHTCCHSCDNCRFSQASTKERIKSRVQIIYVNDISFPRHSVSYQKC